MHRGIGGGPESGAGPTPIERREAVAELAEDTAGDAFERIYHANYRSVLGYLLRRTDEQTAQDVLSETFLVAWRRLADVPEESLPWLLGVARRTLSNHRRAHARQDALQQKVAAHTPQWTRHDGAEVVDAVAALRSLSERDREVLMLHAWEDLPVERIAEVLGCTRASARLRLHRARKRLGRVLAELSEEVE